MINVTIGQIGKSVKIRQCREVDEVVVPKEIGYDAEGQRQKRFLPDLSGIAGSIGGAVGGAVDTLFRVSIHGIGIWNPDCYVSYMNR